jgi:hypothetical protein
VWRLIELFSHNARSIGRMGNRWPADGIAPAATVFGAQYDLMEQLALRKIVDATFMIAAMVSQGVEVSDIRRYFAALRRAQADIDVSHQPYTRYYANELPERHRTLVDAIASLRTPFLPGRVCASGRSQTISAFLAELELSLVDPA